MAPVSVILITTDVNVRRDLQDKTVKVCFGQNVIMVTLNHMKWSTKNIAIADILQSTEFGKPFECSDVSHSQF